MTCFAEMKLLVFEKFGDFNVPAPIFFSENQNVMTNKHYE